MQILAACVGTAIFGVGVVALFSPERLFQLVAWETDRGRHLAAAIRVVFGGVLLAAAAESSSPQALRVIGAIALVAGAASALVPSAQWRALVTWWSGRTAVARASGGVALLLGAFIVRATL